jgi:2-oxoglutarate dehydrogenase E2 component (dihydrolipoamide succinyltransferase)
MRVEVKIPAVGESISEVEIGEWLKADGDPVEKDENIAVIESDKATFELAAPAAGILTARLKKNGEPAAIGEIIGYIEPGDSVRQKAVEKPVASGDRAHPAAEGAEPRSEPQDGAESPARVMPAAERLLHEHGLRRAEVKPTGPGGRILKEDVLAETERRGTREHGSAPVEPPSDVTTPARTEQAVPMSLLRRRISARLVEAQQNAALLTTFNEIDMTEVMALRRKHQALFQEKHRVRLGYMSFFVKAAIDALRLVPEVNAEIRGDAIVYRKYFDIGVAIGSGKGLVVPVLRNAGFMSFAQIETAIADFGERAQQNKLTVDEMTGGTFTISNGGIYGSLLSTPIVNPPQSGILGMHAIQDRPVARDGAVVVRPMMYVALTYDHRIIDGREAVTFLRRVKEAIEEPARLLLEI